MKLTILPDIAIIIERYAAKNVCLLETIFQEAISQFQKNQPMK